MKAVITVFVLFLGLTAIAVGQETPSVFDQLKSRSATLSKSEASSQIELVSYTNSTFNVSYIASSGFSFTSAAILTNSSYAYIYPITNPSYPAANLSISAYHLTTNNEAAYFNPVIHMSALKSVQTSSYPLDAALYYLSDTLIGNYHFTTSEIKDLTHNTILVTYSESNGIYVLEFQYATTISDFTANESAYYANWLSLNFISTTAVAKTALKSFFLKPDFVNVNLLGQTISPQAIEKFPAYLKVPKER